MWGTVTSNLHTGNNHHTIPPWSSGRNTRYKYNDPSMFQTVPYCRHPLTRRRRLHHLPPFKMGLPLTILLSLSTGNNCYKMHRLTQHIAVSRMTTRFMTIGNQSDSDSDDDNDKHKTKVIHEPSNRLYHDRSTNVEGIVNENTIQAITENKIWYNTASEKIINVAAYMETFRDMEFDNWGRTYNEMKNGMYSWKSQYFKKELKTNDSIYESACGIGMNLYMTLEILEQISDIHNITIYGNDYASKSVEIAKDLYSTNHNNGTFNYRLPSSFGQLGYICEADSTQLDMVPSNSFDLVYTGYISPLKTDTTTNALLSFALADQVQQIQNDWYGKWVGEMIRIAKPGAPIIVEQVSYPYVFFLANIRDEFTFIDVTQTHVMNYLYYCFLFFVHSR